MAVDKAITYLKKKAPKGEFLAYINKKEAAMLKKAGGSGELVNGIPSYRSARGMASKSRSRSYSSPSKSSTSQHSPHTRSGYTGPTNYGPQQPPQQFIGGQRFNVTPETRGDRDRATALARTKQQIMNQTKLGGNRIDKFGNTKKSLFKQGGGGLGSLLASLFGMFMGIPGLGLLTGGLGSLGDKLGDTFGNFNETMRGINPVTGKANTQAEYEAMIADRRTQNRIDKMQERINRGYNQIGFGNFTKQTGPITDNQRATLAGLLGQKDRFGNQFGPSTAQNVLTGRDLKGFTPSKPTFSDPFRNTVGTTTKVNTTNDAVSSTTPINNLQQRVDVMNQFDLPLNYSPNDLQAAAKRAMTQPGFTTTLAPYEKGVPQELQFFDGRPFTATAYDPYKVNTQQQGINTIDVGYPSNDLMAGLTKMQQKMLAGPQKNLRNIMGISDQEILNNISPFNDPEDPATLEEVQTFYGADGGLASMFTRRG